MKNIIKKQLIGFVIVLLLLISRTAIVFGIEDYNIQKNYYQLQIQLSDSTISDNIDTLKLTDKQREELRILILGLRKGIFFKNEFLRKVEENGKLYFLVEYYEKQIDKLNKALQESTKVIKENNWLVTGIVSFVAVLINTTLIIYLNK